MVKKEEIKKIAKLCRLKLKEEEIEKYSQQLSKIIDYFKLLSELDTEGVEPTLNAYRTKNVFREDKEKEFGNRKKIMECPGVKAKKDLFVAKSVF